MRHLLHDLDLSAAEQSQILDLALKMKAAPSEFTQTLAGKVLGMIFMKSSTRTRVSFEAGMLQLGGSAIFLSSRDIQIGRGEPISDMGNVLSRYLDVIMFRAFAHADVLALAAASSVPVINGLDDYLHPCQALADLLTIKEHKGEIAGKQLVYVGDGNNVANSLYFAGALAGLSVRVVAPQGYLPQDKVLEEANAAAATSGACMEATSDLAGIEGADVVYADVWASMGQEEEAKQRLKNFEGYQVDAALFGRAKSDAIFMHCLPAHRGEEVSAEVIDGPASVIFDQAENRMHAQKALMTFLLG
jgi:ornithine carbamoyltransferase